MTETANLRDVIRLLVVDDVQALAESLADALRAYDGIDVLGIATNGLDAVEMSRAFNPDVVLMDIRMPVMDGIKATQRITTEPASPKVLMMTAYDDESLVREAMDAGADGYLVKGTLVADTVRAIRAVMAKPTAT